MFTVIFFQLKPVPAVWYYISMVKGGETLLKQHAQTHKLLWEGLSVNLGYHRWRCSTSPCISLGSGRHCGSQSPQIGSVCPARICLPQPPWIHQSNHRKLENDPASGTSPCTVDPSGESDQSTRTSMSRIRRFPTFSWSHIHSQYTESTHVQHPYLIICANIYHHRKTPLRSDASTGSVQTKFSNRDAHSIDTQVP